MGEYIAYRDLNISTELQQYLSRSSTTDEPDRAVHDKAILYAEGMAKARLGVGYTLPQDDDSKTEYVKGLIADLTIFVLWLRLDRVAMPEKITDARDFAIKELDLIASRDVTTGLDTDDEAEAQENPFGNYVRG